MSTRHSTRAAVGENVSAYLQVPHFALIKTIFGSIPLRPNSRCYLGKGREVNGGIGVEERIF